MSAGWVAGSVRARGLAQRRAGAAAARELAACGSMAEALRLLALTHYGHAGMPEQTLAGAQHAVAKTLLWDLRVLAGYLPGDGIRMLRTLAAWFELANVDELLQTMTGRPAGPEFQLGALATAWSRLRPAASIAELRQALAASSWHDPAADSLLAVRLGLRARWAARAAALGDPVYPWAAGAAALLLAGEHAAGRMVQPAIMDGALGLLGAEADRAATLDELSATLPAQARWVFAGVSAPADLWRAETAWWARVESDGSRLLRTSGTGSGAVLGAVAVLAADAWRVRAALEAAARGGGSLEAYDAMG